MTLERGYLAAAPIADGRVLVAGGAGFLPPSGASAELFTPGLSHRLRGRKLTATVAVAGTLTAADAEKGLRRSAAATRKRQPSLQSTSASGGPGSISLRLRPTARAKRILKRNGKFKIRARLKSHRRR